MKDSLSRRVPSRHLAGSLAAWVLCAALPAAILPAHAQGYPNKPLRFMVGFPAGGSTDITARFIAPRLAERVGQPVVVDNRSGAGGIVGLDAIAKSAPDGHTFGFGVSGAMTIAGTLQANLPYNTLRDFAPVTNVASNPLILVASNAFPPRDIRELIAYAKARPKQLSFGSGGSGTAMHLAGALLNIMADLDLNHVPYKGTNPAANDLVGGQIPLAIIDVASTRGFIKAGQIRAIGTMDTRRSQVAPDIPTIGESGLPGFVVPSWFGVVAPARTPPEVINQLNAHLVAILESPETRDRLLTAGLEPRPTTPAEFGELIRSEVVRWAKVIKDAKITSD